jgi:hypothetical protein
MKKLALLLALVASPVFSGDLPSGLDDPLKSKATCLRFLASFENGYEFDFAAIAWLEGIVANNRHSDDAMFVGDALLAKADRKVVSALIRGVCRSEF